MLGDDWTADERRAYAAQIRELEAREQAQIAEGEALLDARWSNPVLTPEDAYELANIAVRTNPTGPGLGAQYIEPLLPGVPFQEPIEETLTPDEQEVEDGRDRDDQGRPGADDQAGP